MPARRLSLALLALLTLLAPRSSFAEEKAAPKVKIAVLNVRGLGNVKRETKGTTTTETLLTSDGQKVELSGIASLVTTELGKDLKLDVISSKDIESMVGFERQKELLGCGDSSCLVEIGGALGRDYLVAAEVAEVGSTYLLSLSLISVAKAKAAARLTKRVQFVEQISQSMIGATQELLEIARKRDAEDPKKRDKKVAILDVKASGADASRVQGLASLVASEVAARPDTVVTTGEDIRAIIGFERQRTALGCEEASCLAEIGGALGVDFIITTEVSRVGDEWVLALSMVDIKKATASNRTAARVRRPDLLVDHTISGVKELFFELSDDKNKSAGRYITKEETNVFGWVLTGLGVAALGAGAGIEAYSFSKVRDSKNGGPELSAEQTQAYYGMNGAGWPTLGAGALLVGFGLYDVLVRNPSGERLEFVPSASTDGAAVSMRLPLP